MLLVLSTLLQCWQKPSIKAFLFDLFICWRIKRWWAGFPRRLVKMSNFSDIIMLLNSLKGQHKCAEPRSQPFQLLHIENILGRCSTFFSCWLTDWRLYGWSRRNSVSHCRVLLSLLRCRAVNLNQTAAVSKPFPFACVYAASACIVALYKCHQRSESDKSTWH